MARQFQPYEPELHKLSSGTSNSPSSPYPRGDTPLSFKANVNRAKTKRWVEAKKYSYDGNDWGDDEYGEYDDDETPPLPQPSSLNQSTGDIPSMFTRDVTRPPLPSMDRSRSMDHVGALNAAGAGAQRTMSSDRITVDPTNRAVPIVRPAEIYKRMRAESAARQQASEAGYFVENPSGAAPPAEPVSQDMPSSSHAEQQGAAPTGDRMLHPTPGGAERPLDIESTPHASYTAETSDNAPPIINLPDMKRLSGFNPDLSLGSDSAAQGEPESTAQQHQLQHNPSLGFRSVVHQAFDVPETPSTTVDSIARSNSDSTSVISPIIPPRNPSEIKTPTIVEEPESISTPKEDPENMVFKPGHRRDLSLPSPNNSPSRNPVITSVEGTPPSAVGEMSTETPSDSPQNVRATSQKAAVQLPQVGKDLPAPLSLGIGHPASEPTITTGDGVPVIIPSPSAENSPQDAESDRLRKEIIRSLSRENTPSEDPDHEDEPRPEAQRQDSSLMLDEYERYWTEGPISVPPDVKQPAPEYSSASAASQDSPAPPAPLVAGPGPSAQASKPKLARRFSWESSSSGDPAPESGVQSPPAPMPGQFPVPTEDEAPPAETAPVNESVVEDREESEPPSTEKPKLTIVPPIPDNRSIISDGHLPEVYNADAIPDSHADEGPQAGSDRRSSRVMLTTPATVEPTLLGFRDILGMKTSEDRVRAFNETRAKFGTIDTGLNQWISFTVHTHPEHNDVVEKSSKLTSSGPKAPVSRGKFPKLAALGKADLTPSGSGHVRRPSAPLGAMMNKQQVEQRGKELLHTAGVLGGRAGEAAKGFFARGRSKLKGGGNDKGFQALRGYRRPVPLAELQQAAALVVPVPARPKPSHPRHSVHFGSLPVARRMMKRKEVPHQQQQQQLRGDSGTSRIQLVINGVPLSPLSPLTPDSEIPKQQSRRQASDQLSGAGAATAGSAQGMTTTIIAGGEDPAPPAVFVQRRRGSVQPSISSLDTHDAAADPPLLALNAPAASSSLSLPSFHSPDVNMAAPDDDPCPLSALFGRRLPADQSRRSSVSSSRHPIAAETHFQSPDSTPHARLAAMKMKYGDKIRDIRRISLGPSSPPAEQKPTLRNRLSGFLRPKSRGSKLESRPETPIPPSKPASLSNSMQPPSGHTRFYSLDHAIPNASSNLTALPRIPTPDSFRQAQNQPIFLPHASTPALPSPSPTPGDYFSPSTVPVYDPSRTPHNGSPERGRSASRTYVQELHFRSRSPNEFALRPEETTLPNTDESDPASGLGRFAHNPRTSRVGDQELPWKLSIPGLGGDIDEHGEDEVDYQREKTRVEFTAVLDTTTTTTDEKHHTTAPDRSLSPTPSPAPESTAPPAPSQPHDRPPSYVFSQLPPPPPLPLSQLPPSPPPLSQPSRSAPPGLEPKSMCKDETCATSIICHPPAPIPQRKPVTTTTNQLLPNPAPTPNKTQPYAHPHRPVPPRALVSSPIELPVPATDADTDTDSCSSSEPEIVMSSTAYPGQEWRPVGYMGYE